VARRHGAGGERLAEERVELEIIGDPEGVEAEAAAIFGVEDEEGLAVEDVEHLAEEPVALAVAPEVLPKRIALREGGAAGGAPGEVGHRRALEQVVALGKLKFFGSFRIAGERLELGQQEVKHRHREGLADLLVGDFDERTGEQPDRPAAIDRGRAGAQQRLQTPKHRRTLRRGRFRVLKIGADGVVEGLAGQKGVFQVCKEGIHGRSVAHLGAFVERFVARPPMRFLLLPVLFLGTIALAAHRSFVRELEEAVKRAADA